MLFSLTSRQVDHIGGLFKAVDIAYSLAGLKSTKSKKPFVYRYQVIRDDRPRFGGLFGGGARVATAAKRPFALNRPMLLASEEVFVSGIVGPESTGASPALTELGLGPQLAVMLNVGGVIPQALDALDIPTLQRLFAAVKNIFDV